MTWNTIAERPGTAQAFAAWPAESTPAREGAFDGPPAPRWAIGAAAGGIAALMSLTPSLLPRSSGDKAAIAGLTFAAAYGATSLVERGIDAADRHIPGGPIAAHAAVGVAALAAPISLALSGGSRHRLALAAGGLGTIIGGAAVVGLVSDTLSTAVREPRAGRDDAARGTGDAEDDGDGVFGAGISTKWAIAGASLVVGAAGLWYMKRRLVARDAAVTAAHMAAGVEPAGTLIPRATLSKQGLKFVDQAARDTAFIKDPVRVYAGLASASTPAERAALAVAELERQGGLHRSYLLVASPTGTGWVNNMPIAASEHFARGDIASVALQYSTKPSSLSLHRLGVATDTQAEFLAKVSARIRQLHPDGGGPKVLLYGESLGAWGTQRVYGANPSLLDQHGIFGALWAGKPYHSTWSAAIRPDIAVDASSLDDLARLPKERLDAMRVLSFAQDNDPVKHFNFASLVAGGPRPSPYEPHVPIVSFFKGLGDMKNALPTQPVGTYVTRGHDYSGIYAELARRAFHFDDVPAERVADVVGRIAAQEQGYTEAVKSAARTLAASAG